MSIINSELNNTSLSGSLYQPLRINIFSDTFVDRTELKFEKGSNRPILEPHVKYVYNNHDIRSNYQASIYLNVSRLKWKKYAMLYIEPESKLSYFELFKRRAFEDRAIRAKKLFLELRNRKVKASHHIRYINKLNTNTLGKRFKVSTIKRNLIEHGILKEECACCGFSEKSIAKNDLINNKVPLLLDHINEDYKDFRVANLQLLCLNCFFILVGNPIMIYQKYSDYIY